MRPYCAHRGCGRIISRALPSSGRDIARGSDKPGHALHAWTVGYGPVLPECVTFYLFTLPLNPEPREIRGNQEVTPTHVSNSFSWIWFSLSYPPFKALAFPVLVHE